MVLLRFAPSPTGPLHLGGLRMALYNHLFARKHGGKWILRIEDTDASRLVPGSVEGIQKALDWAGLEYDYGPDRDSRYGPYFQTERLELYRSYAKKLLESGHAYRCFCSADKLASIRERLARAGSNSTYDKSCVHITDEESARKARAGEKFVIRLNDSHPPSRPPAVDLVFGHLKDAHASLSTDSVLLKSDSFPTYHLASVVDDHEMKITHVLRGEEWITSFPLHLDLYAHLGLSPPKFAHIPILLNSDGTKMSKRKGDVQVVDYMRRGWEPAAVLNWLALAGWGVTHEETSPDSTSRTHVKDAPDSTAVMSLPELVESFDISVLTQRSSGLDVSKLEYINKHHLALTWATEEGMDTLAERAHIHVKEAFPHSQYTTIDNIIKTIRALEGRLTNIQDIPRHAPFLFVEPDLTSDEAQSMFAVMPDVQDRSRMLQMLRDVVDTQVNDWRSDVVFSIFQEQLQAAGLPRKIFLKVLRAYLTGMKDGPPLADILTVLGPERTRARLSPSRV
ncbi:glutamyl-tRNA synthetase [Guyanagaster necrorhizus]|uniref:Glutamate--tRNA ligase, mitochondrial n=1 Tax=Guyanagaster necrorhizus TaxID=856835 RepID=A0A9P8AYJ9_9AGAR|nr:glutamyl-tRNA synthetase [Guyanagaster necrorhizus MCA 3950]KAG7452974.1 glutamyl-tRNA synthetase [Guyanagaster necrorhizus MCA 3950]